MRVVPAIFAVCFAVAAPQAADAQVWYGTSTASGSSGGYAGVTTGAPAASGGGASAGVTMRSGNTVTAAGSGSATTYSSNGASTVSPSSSYGGVVPASDKERMTQELIGKMEKKYGPLCPKAKQQAASIVEERIRFDEQMNRIRQSALRNVERNKQATQQPYYRKQTSSHSVGGVGRREGM